MKPLMSDLNTKQMVKQVFLPIYKEMRSTYGGLFSPSNKADAAEHFVFWVNKIIEDNLCLNTLSQCGLSIMKDARFLSKPPTHIQFNEFINSKGKSKGDNFDEIFLPIYLNLKERYKALFDKSEIQKSSTYNVWKEDVKELTNDVSVLKQSLKVILSSPNFLLYPPNLNEYLLTVRIVLSGLDIPHTHEAIEIAKSNEKDIHPLVRYARYKYGSLEFKSSNSVKIRTEFGRIYTGLVIDYIEGDLDLTNFEKSLEEEVIEIPMDKDDVLKELDDLLKSF